MHASPDIPMKRKHTSSLSSAQLMNSIFSHSLFSSSPLLSKPHPNYNSSSRHLSNKQRQANPRKSYPVPQRTAVVGQYNSRSILSLRITTASFQKSKSYLGTFMIGWRRLSHLTTASRFSFLIHLMIDLVGTRSRFFLKFSKKGSGLSLMLGCTCRERLRMG